jgi:hypothetical protein
MEKQVSDLTLKRRPWRRHVTRWERIVQHEYQGDGSVEKPFVVDWLEDGDEENPMTWDPTYKWSITLLVAIATLAVSMASSTL